MAEKPPLTESELRHYVAEWGFEPPSDAKLDKLRQTAAMWSETLRPLTDFSQEKPRNREHWEPSSAEDPNAAYLTRTDIVQHETGPLAGARIAIKDNIYVAGVPLTCGSQAVTNYHPDVDATVVQRILEAGGKIVGKTAMSEFAMGGSRETMRFRLPQNPCNRERYPGGSSSGSAIAVAEGSADAALGSDTAASIRCPATFCGVIGIKPTPELVSQHGFIGFAPSLDAIGVLSRSVKTGATVLESIAGEDPADPRTHDREVGEYIQAAERGETNPPTDTTIGIPDSFTADPDVFDAVEESLNDFADAGATLEQIQIPNIEYALPTWLALASAEFRAYTRAFGQRATKDPLEIAFEKHANELNEQLYEFLICADCVHRHGDNRYATLALRAKTQVQEGIEKALESVDVLATPTMPTVAPRWEEQNATNQETNFLSAVANTAPFNVTGHPAISVPCGRVDGLPTGLQFVGQRFDEERLLQAAAAFESYVGSDLSEIE